MTKLTDMQLIVLSRAAARDDGIAIVPDKMNKAAASKVGASLIARKLMREVRAKPGMPVWREDEDNRGCALLITREGRKAIGVEDDEAIAESGAKSAKARWQGGRSEQVPAGTATRPEGSPRAGSKQALVIGMLSGKGGATLDALVEATGWLPHTTRAALTGLRQRGYTLVREARDGKPSLYRIATGVVVAAA